MKKVFTCDNLMTAGQIKSHLVANGIRCIMKNESLTGGIGELPPIECWPEVWVLDERDVGMAEQIIASMQAEQTTRHEAWRCKCGESIEGQFTECWNCGASRP